MNNERSKPGAEVLPLHAAIDFVYVVREFGFQSWRFSRQHVIQHQAEVIVDVLSLSRPNPLWSCLVTNDLRDLPASAGRGAQAKYPAIIDLDFINRSMLGIHTSYHAGDLQPRCFGNNPA